MISKPEDRETGSCLGIGEALAEQLLAEATSGIVHASQAVAPSASVRACSAIAAAMKASRSSRSGDPVDSRSEKLIIGLDMVGQWDVVQSRVTMGEVAIKGREWACYLLICTIAQHPRTLVVTKGESWSELQYASCKIRVFAFSSICDEQSDFSQFSDTTSADRM